MECKSAFSSFNKPNILESENNQKSRTERYDMPINEIMKDNKKLQRKHEKKKPEIHSQVRAEDELRAITMTKSLKKKREREQIVHNKADEEELES